MSFGPAPFIQGYNVVVDQKANEPPFEARPSEENPKRHGFFRVHPVQSGGKDSRFAQALLLDYGLGANGLQLSGLLRDYLVQVYADDPTLLLGSADLAIGPLRIPSGFFVLSRQNQHNFGS
ncbi:MAG: hypothetical protein IPJ88_16150 [Myxococcales bacterium]|nr:MAG: hypothetical protein IPJ88_16150 [Myxococcales bacterium]